MNPIRTSDLKNIINKNIYSTFITISSFLIIVLSLRMIFKEELFLNKQSFYYSFFLISFTSQIFFNLLILRTLKKKRKWLFFGNEEIFNFLECEKNLLDCNLSLEYVDEITVDLINKNFSSNLDGLIIDDKNSIDKFEPLEVFKIQLLGLRIFTPLKWCEEYLQNSPPKLMHNYEFTKNKFSHLRIGTIQLRIKRAGDFLFALFLLIITLPILLFLAIIIYFQDFGPVLYKQRRTGLNGKFFYIYKLRSMKLNAEKNGPQWSVENDSRITPVGKFIRITRIDELPQLICVLRGEMSLIGPRPERPEFDKEFLKNIPLYELRYFIRPGLSGWAQVNYPYGASEKDALKKLSFDLYYISNYSLLLDFLILFKTIKTVFNRKLSIPMSNISS